MSVEAIHKYTVLPCRDTPMPFGAQILSAGAQGDDIVVWALVRTSNSYFPRIIVAAATGELAPGGNFIDTVQMDDGLVFHLFDGGFRQTTSSVETPSGSGVRDEHQDEVSA